MSDGRSDHGPWWSSHEIGIGQGLRCALGPLTLKAFRTDDAWRLWVQRQGADESQPSDVRVERLARMPEDEGNERFVFRESPGRIRLRPVLADRAVVVSARQPVFIPPGEQATFFLSTPVWISVDLGEPPRSLREIPVLRLSDTWFGPPTREGELCYAARTHARSHVDEVPRRSHRAVTPVTVRNEAASPLPIDRLNLPVPVLGVYGDAQTGLWTEAVHLTHRAGSDLSVFRVVSGVPPQAPRAEHLSGPRTEAGRSGLVRAFSSLFG